MTSWQVIPYALATTRINVTRRRPTDENRRLERARHRPRRRRPSSASPPSRPTPRPRRGASARLVRRAHRGAGHARRRHHRRAHQLARPQHRRRPHPAPRHRARRDQLAHVRAEPVRRARSSSAADLIIVNGLHLEEPTLDLAEASKRPETPILKLGDDTITEDEWLFDFSFPRVGGRPQPAPVDERPVRASSTRSSCATGSREADPANADYYAANFDRFAAAPRRPRRAHPGGRADRARGEARKLLTYHDSWAYWAREYGFDVIGAVQASDFSDPSPRDVADLIDQIREPSRCPPSSARRCSRARSSSRSRASPARRSSTSCATTSRPARQRCARAHLPGHAPQGHGDHDRRAGRAGHRHLRRHARGGHLPAVTIDAEPGRRPRGPGLRRSSASRGSAAATAAPRCSRASTCASRGARSWASSGPSGRGQDDAAAGDGRRSVPQAPRARVTVDGQTVVRGRTPRVGWVPQLETVDWHFPATVREVVLMGRWSRRTVASLDDRARTASPPTGCSSGWASAASATARSGSSRAASSSACSWPAP